MAQAPAVIKRQEWGTYCTLPVDLRAIKDRLIAIGDGAARTTSESKRELSSRRVQRTLMAPADSA